MLFRKWCGAALLWLALVTGGTAHAQSVGTDIQKVISEQISAFLADDFDAAFGYASPTIRDIFGSADRFGMMVRQGYPMVWRPSDVRFTDLRERQGLPLQGVVVTDAGGQIHVLDYEMIEVEGEWRINGVTVRRPAGAGA